MRAAVVQFTAGSDKPANLTAVLALVEQAAGLGADLAVCPEASMHGFGPADLRLADVAEPVDGPFVSALAEAARRNAITVVAGMFEPVESDPARAYNTVVVLGPDGTLVTRYRKIHLFDALGRLESERLEPGDPAATTFPCGGLTVGLMTCYDLRFPELGRALADAGAQAIVVPSAWYAGPLKEEQWLTLLRARAIENTCYVVAADQAPPEFVGRSVVIDPAGVTVAMLADVAAVAVADVDPVRVDDVRRRMPSLRHRRFDVVPRT
jgi:predicted amidohydrolase